MASKSGFVQTNINLPEALATQLTLATAAQNITKNELVSAAIAAHLEGSLSQSVTDTLHNHLSTIYTDVKADLVKTTTALQQLREEVHALTALVSQQEQRYTSLLKAFDRLSGRDRAPASSLRTWLRGDS
jgi:hypothetical protein